MFYSSAHSSETEAGSEPPKQCSCSSYSSSKWRHTHYEIQSPTLNLRLCHFEAGTREGARQRVCLVNTHFTAQINQSIKSAIRVQRANQSIKVRNRSSKSKLINQSSQKSEFKEQINQSSQQFECTGGIKIRSHVLMITGYAKRKTHSTSKVNMVLNVHRNRKAYQGQGRGGTGVWR